MKETHWLDNPYLESTYKASSIPRRFKYHIDYWLIGQSKDYVDAKRIAPIMFMALNLVLAWFLFILADYMEIFNHLLTSNTFPNQTRSEFVIDTLKYYLNENLYYKFIFGIFLASILFLLGLHYLFSPYPRPVRFNQKHGLVYTKFMGKVWVADWNKTKVKLWRGTNPFTFFLATHRAISVCLYSLDKNNHVVEHWVLLSGINNNLLDDLELGGDPCLLYWNWLNQYMQGAKFESQVEGKSSKRSIPDPKIGRLWLLEKLMRFRSYKFSKSIDKQAIELDAKIRSVSRYPKFTASEVPKNPFFTWQYHYPEREMPNADGTLTSQQAPEVTDPVQLKIIELSAQLAEQGIDNIYQHFSLHELEAALVSKKAKSNEEIALIKLYIEEGGYNYKVAEEISSATQKETDEAAIAEQSMIEELKQRQATIERAKELEAIVKKQGVTKSYRDYTLASLKKALASDTTKSPEELELIKLYIELGGYEGQR